MKRRKALRRSARPFQVAGYLLLMVVAAGSLDALAQEGNGLIGTPASEWEATGWMNSDPLRLKDLKGRVVLVRWWTGPECPFCAASAPHLVRWHETYGPEGLAVIGFYHHKSPEPLTRERVAELAERYGFRFPVAVDSEWRTLRRWWLEGPGRKWTSVSFLIDREGVIRYVHPGGSYSPEEARTIEALIEELLKEGAS